MFKKEHTVLYPLYCIENNLVIGIMGLNLNPSYLCSVLAYMLGTFPKKTNVNLGKSDSVSILQLLSNDTIGYVAKAPVGGIHHRNAEPCCEVFKIGLPNTRLVCTDVLGQWAWESQAGTIQFVQM